MKTGLMVSVTRAPFAEMISEHTIISLPSSLVRNLDNPTAVMTFGMMVRLQDELGSHGTRRYMAERINIDVQVSYGYLRAGYPTQGPTVSSRESNEPRPSQSDRFMGLVPRAWP